ncbi:remodeling and spacing factor 1-like isoform X2 [Alosa sapidissima]|uniref:remodeling and spacing factor 1-like isoform X2 n=1 Tax=Alosa sapidissima TaxID=34773 RepID=UPI001C0862C0|nr:remodeling and spacing factor 1-like isoform X2 [Alosa sapidissima]
MSEEMNKLTSSVERPKDGEDFRLIIEQALSKIQACLGNDGTVTEVKTPVTVSSNNLQADIDVAILNIRRQVESLLTSGKMEEEDKTSKMEETSVKMEEEDRVSAKIEEENRASAKIEEETSVKMEEKEDRASVKMETSVKMEEEDRASAKIEEKENSSSVKIEQENRASVKIEEETSVKMDEDYRASVKMETSVKMEEDRASTKVEEISMKMELQEASVMIDQVANAFEVEICGKMGEEEEVKELLGYFTALEGDRRNLQNLLRERREEYKMQLKALERERIQEQVERDRQMKESEETLLSALKSVAIGKEKLMADLRNQSGKQSLTFLLRPVSAVRGNQPKKWWSFKKQKASTDAALQSATQLGGGDGNPPVEVPTSSASEDAKEADLQKVKKLEERVRKAEFKKQQKAAEKAAEAEKKEKKAEEKRQKKEGKKAEKKGKRVKDNNLTDHAGPSGVSNTGLDQ